MSYNFLSIDELIFSLESELVTLLYEYDLIGNLNGDTKKIILYCILEKVNKVLHDRDLLLYHTRHLDSSHELLKCYDGIKLNEFINKICKSIKLHTNRLFFLSAGTKKPSKSEDLDGEVVDEISLIENSDPVNPKKLMDFLKKSYQKDLFDKLSQKIY